jgi:hypothetical protein
VGEKNESGKKSLEEIDNSALIRAMQEMKAKGDAEAEKAFLNELVKAVFISPANVEESKEKNKWKNFILIVTGSDCMQSWISRRAQRNVRCAS